MSAIGNIRTALQHYCMAQEPLGYALGHAMSGAPFKRGELEDAEANLRRAADAIKAALASEGNVVRGPFQAHFKRPADLVAGVIDALGDSIPTADLDAIIPKSCRVLGPETLPGADQSTPPETAA